MSESLLESQDWLRLVEEQAAKGRRLYFGQPSVSLASRSRMVFCTDRDENDESKPVTIDLFSNLWPEDLALPPGELAQMLREWIVRNEPIAAKPKPPWWRRFILMFTDPYGRLQT